jgi:hypothetical protein
MKLKTFIPFIILSSNLSFGQIKNNDFETAKVDAENLPQDWNIKKMNGFEFSLDKETKHLGTNSFTIKSTSDSALGKFIPFSQVIEYGVIEFQKIAITVYIKTKDVKGNAGLWCQIWDKDNKQIGFQNLEMQQTKIIGTSEWKKYELNLILNSNCKKLLLGGYLQGLGAVWYDNFTIETKAFTDTPPSKEAKKYIDEFCKIVKSLSIYTKLIDWKNVDTEIEFLSKGINSYEEASTVAAYVLSKLRAVGDNHSFIQPKATSEMATKMNLKTDKPYGKLLPNTIGYVYVPGYASLNDSVSRAFAKSIQDIIKDLDTKNKITGWIVDLQGNTGGNMYPMITGLGPLIGNGTLGHFLNANGKVNSSWFYSKGSTGVVRIKDSYVVSDETKKVAVLIGSRTSSSGEMTTVSFIGKPNAKLFGQASGGYTTGNSLFKLKDGSTLALATSYISDRNDKPYYGKIMPDVLVTENEDILKVAEQWLLEK